MKKKSWKNLISEEDYWNVIEESLQESKYSISKQEKSLLEIFRRKTEKELIGFWYHAVELYRKAYTSELWAAAYIVRGGCGDDSFHYFRCWLSTREKQVYYNALNNPDSLIDEVHNYKYRDDIKADLITVSLDEYYEQIHPEGIGLSTIIEEEYNEEFENKGEIEMSEILVFNWEENDEDSLRRICPNLFEKYRKRPLKSRY